MLLDAITTCCEVAVMIDAPPAIPWPAITFLNIPDLQLYPCSCREMFGDDALGQENLRMVQVARQAGSSAKFCGSGGAVVALCHTEDQAEHLYGESPGASRILLSTLCKRRKRSHQSMDLKRQNSRCNQQSWSLFQGNRGFIDWYR